jgi:hypothetical protein
LSTVIAASGKAASARVLYAAQGNKGSTVQGRLGSAGPQQRSSEVDARDRRTRSRTGTAADSMPVRAAARLVGEHDTHALGIASVRLQIFAELPLALTRLVHRIPEQLESTPLMNAAIDVVPARNHTALL